MNLDNKDLNDIYGTFMPNKKKLNLLKLAFFLFVFPAPWAVAIALLVKKPFPEWLWVDILFWILPFIVMGIAFFYVKEVYFKKIKQDLDINEEGGMSDFIQKFQEKFANPNQDNTKKSTPKPISKTDLTSEEVEDLQTHQVKEAKVIEDNHDTNKNK